MKYCFTFASAIEDIKSIKERQNGILCNGNISAIAKKWKIRVKDFKVILKDEGIIK